ncbi:O-acetyl-ADP-ribose deacetylase [Marispirochaeta sp.]|jgi:O-acetyl-ADP-ribose deacetylase|uniref:O-acetyl-ADP-ribose deacetylase n=1 Tax=Marispirochaeta sp. TaxID=2038653 RepID=UPI0029C88DD3|nr:O-acetyl-ADP-ribose deacetylase [Marispirochaeta sp.]
MERIEERIELMQGDITTLQVDAIVNAANSSLMGGGGVDGAIHRAGGAAILAACREIRQNQYPHGMPAGKAVITTAGNLSAKYVIHTVGPRWGGDETAARRHLAEAYGNSLELALQNRCKSIAFPAVSTGVYGFPKKLAAPIAYGTVSTFLREHDLPKKVIFVFFSLGDLEIFRSGMHKSIAE